MQVYLPMENYIKKLEFDYGVGVLSSVSEEKAKAQTSRKKNVASYNQWLLTDIPEQENFLNIYEPVNKQSQIIIDGLKNQNFILTLFISDTKKILAINDTRENYDIQINEMIEEKFNLLQSMTGLELVQFVNKRCRNHDMAKSSALLYQANIKGTFIPNGEESDFLIFNPHKDFINVTPKSAVLSASKLIL